MTKCQGNVTLETTFIKTWPNWRFSMQRNIQQNQLREVNRKGICFRALQCIEFGNKMGVATPFLYALH